ncbi:MAG: glycosyltransferase 87 family protein [Actinobacteria bacterium]|nr:glycosyltransferase 87 family protein [Actinomycetota bacterium]
MDAVTTTEPSETRERRSWDLRPLLAPIGVYVVSRVVTYVAFLTATLVQPGATVAQFSARWDAGWYLSIVTHGYERRVPAGIGEPAQTRIAFFPGYPVVVRAVSRLTGWNALTAGVVVSLACGLAATLVVWAVAARLTDRRTADRSAALFCFFPSAFILNMAYSEGMFILAAGVCLYALLAEWWLVAGLAGAVASATRPTGFALAVCCLVVAAPAVVRRRNWRAVLAPALAPLGAVAYAAYLHFHTGTVTAWEDTETRGWEHHVDYGRTTARIVWRYLTHPRVDFNNLMSTLVVALVALAAVAMWRCKPPMVLPVFTAVVVVPGLVSTNLVSTARYGWAAFPMVSAFARRLRGPAYYAALGAAAGLMVMLAVVAATTRSYIP